LIVERAWSLRESETTPSVPRILRILVTFYYFNLALFFFRASDFETAWVALKAFATFQSDGLQRLPENLWLLFFALVLLHFACYHILRIRTPEGALNRRVGLLARPLPRPLFACLYGSAFAVCLSLVPTGYRPFIYFQF
jgi:alginate O-acetyltransferase complex protein AlgI